MCNPVLWDKKWENCESASIRTERKTYQQKMVRLGSKATMDPEMTHLYDAYNAEVEELFMATLSAKRKQKQIESTQPNRPV